MSGGPSPGYEYMVIRKDGSRFPAIAYASPIIKEGKGVGLRGVLVDITERKKMEAQLAESQRLAAIGETTTMVGHDLRNPLQTMTSTLYLASRLLSSGRIEERNEALGLLKELDDKVYYMDKIVSDLQDYARPIENELVETDLPDLIREAISNAKIPATVEVSYMVQEGSSRATANPILLRRVLVNLILNAVQAMPNGGKLTIFANGTQDSAAISVQDTGTGIPAENLDRLFNPFFTTKAQGQGLGLAVCKRLVEAQGGEITVKSEVGKGSTFTINLRTDRTPEAN
jgi:two-component system sensor histidine kinase HydH